MTNVAVAPTTALLPRASDVIRNDYLNAVVAIGFMAVVALLLVVSLREWWLILSRRKQGTLTETPFVESVYAR